jgi:hypothetical protein
MVRLVDFSRILSAIFIAIALVIAGCGQLQGRDEFTKAVMDKSEQEVISAIGKPANVDSSNPEHVVWTYHKATYDITNGNKEDESTMVIFTPNPATGKLKVVEIKYG